MIKFVFASVVVIFVAVLAQTNANYEPQYEIEPYTNCGSQSFHTKGKCGGENHGFLHCLKGMFCSQYGL